MTGPDSAKVRGGFLHATVQTPKIKSNIPLLAILVCVSDLGLPQTVHICCFPQIGPLFSYLRLVRATSLSLGSFSADYKGKEEMNDKPTLCRLADTCIHSKGFFILV